MAPKLVARLVRDRLRISPSAVVVLWPCLISAGAARAWSADGRRSADAFASLAEFESMLKTGRWFVNTAVGLMWRRLPPMTSAKAPTTVAALSAKPKVAETLYLVVE